MSEISTEPIAEDEGIHPVIKSTGDFSDRLSPMLVKELRQGLKGYGFMVLFIAVQAILAFYILGAAFADSYNDTGHGISIVVFYLLSMATLIAQPLRGMSAISGEIKENTIELMVMTRLSAWRIAFGKWISIVSQSALLIAAVTPYLIVRYFFGGMQLFPEIMVLVSIFILSASFTAITVGLSAIPSFIIRGFVSAGIAITVFLVCTEIFDSRRDYQDLLDICGFASPSDTAIFFIFLKGAIYLGWLALDFGASYIAPVAENRATPRRLIALGLIILSAVVFLLSPNSMIEGLPAIITILAIPVCVISLTEQTFLVPNISASFLERGVLTSSSRYILYPGWQSGIWYTLLLYLIAAASVFVIDTRDTLHILTVVTIVFSTFIFPLAITKLFFSKRHLFTTYLSVTLAFAILSIVTFVVIGITDVRGIALFMCWLPPVQLFLYIEAIPSFYSNRNGSLSYEFVFGMAVISFAINWLICFIRSIPEWQSIRKNEQVTRTMLANINHG